MGKDLAAELSADSLQVSAAMNHPGVIKAFHYHCKQTDYWVPARGMFQVALVDFRERSPAFGVRNTFFVGTLRPWRLLIPPGVGHGYKVIDNEPGVLVYLTSCHYDPSDEGRVDYDDDGVNPHFQFDV